MATFRQRLSLARSFARSWLAWRIDGTPQPISAAFAVTDRCNLRCDYCRTPFLATTELDTPHVLRVLDRLAELGVRRIGITGGEPLVRQDIAAILGGARERGFYVSVNTNLTLHPRQRPVFADVDLVLTSLDGVDGRHQTSRGERALDHVLEAIAELTAAGRPVVAICVVTEHNLDQLEPLLDLAERLGFRMHFQPHCTGAMIARGGAGASLTDERQRRYWAAALRLKRAGRPIASSAGYLETLAGWDDFARPAVFDPRARCAAGRGFLYVDPHGRAWPCTYLRGRLRGTDLLADDWRGALSCATPCTRCCVGPHLEHNLLYQRPVRSTWNALRSYV